MYQLTKQRTVNHWNQGSTIDEHGDHLCHVLDVLGEIYEHQSELMIYSQSPDPVVKFIGWLPDTGLLSQSPEVPNLVFRCVFCVVDSCF